MHKTTPTNNKKTAIVTAVTALTACAILLSPAFAATAFAQKQIQSQTTHTPQLLVILIPIALILTTLHIIKHKNNKKLQNTLYLDPLTGSPNYTALTREAPDLIKNSQQPYAILYMDIYQFKAINDTLGYHTGDRMLKETAHLLETTLNPQERFARIYADIFVLLLQYTRQEQLQNRLDNLFSQLQEIPNPGDTIKPLFRGGVYLLPPNFHNIDKACDLANYAKCSITRHLSGTCKFYDDAMGRRIHIEKQLESDIEPALKHRQFIPYYQPKIDAITGKTAGAEALVRWQHPQRGLLNPGDFLPFYEKIGFIVNIDLSIFPQVCQDLQRWIAEGNRVVPVSVNFSRRHMQDAHFAAKLKAIADEYAIPANLLEVEITETQELENVEVAINFVDALKAYGFRVSIDDYGTGYSSISFLQQLPLDALKLDRKFILNAMKSDRARDIMGHIVAAMQRNAIQVICEGVETEEQRDFVRSLNCRYIQGFFYSRPMPAQQFEAWFTEKGIDKGENLRSISTNINYIVTLQEEKDWLIEKEVQAKQEAEMEKAKLQLALISTGQAVFEYDIESRTLHSHSNFEAFGVRTNEILKIPEDLQKGNFVHPQDIEKVQNGHQRLMAGEERIYYEMRILVRRYEPDAPYNWIRVTLSTITDVNRKPTGAIGVIEDINRQKDFERAFLQESQYRKAFTESSLMAYEMNLTRDTIQRITGSRGFRLEGLWDKMEGSTRYSKLLPLAVKFLVAPEDREQFEEEMSVESLLRLYREGGRERELEYRRITLEGQCLWNAVLVYLGLDQLTGDVIGYAYHRDIQERKEAEQGLIEQAARDPLTGALNRAAAEQVIQEYLRTGRKKDCTQAFLMMDVDQFKKINDTCGHLTGDKCLVSLVKVLKKTLRGDDIIVRMGGDEFAVLLKNLPHEQKAVSIARKLLEGVTEIGPELGMELPTTVSIGIAMAPWAEVDFEYLYHCADKAMYKAKKSEHDHLQVYHTNIRRP